MSVTEATPVTRPEVEVTAADVLNRAADLLGEWGWCKGAARHEDSFCLLGAIAFAANGYPPRSSAITDADCTDLYVTAKEILRPFTGGELGIWNDEPGRTKEQVVAKLREAARAASR